MNKINITTLAVGFCMLFSVDTSIAFTFDQGKNLFNKGKYAEAGDYFRERAASEPENSIHVYNEGLANLRNGNLESAEAAFSEALKLEIDNPVFQSEIYEALAITKFERGRNLISTEINSTVELWKQSQLDFHSAKNLAANDQTDRKETLQSQQALLEKKLKNLIYNDAVSKYKSRDYEGATASFEQAFQLSTPEEFDELHYNQANCKYRIGEQQLEQNPQDTVRTWEKALENYNEAINLRKDKNFPEAEKNKEILLKRLQQLKEQLEQQKQEKQDQENSQESEQQEKEQGNDPPTQSDQNQENNNSDSEQKPKQSNEQKDSSSTRNNNSEKANDDEKSDEPQRDEEEEAGSSVDSGKDENPTDEAKVVPGKMTREQAAQLLQQLKSYERKLPLGNLEHIRKKEKKDNRVGRNW